MASNELDPLRQKVIIEVENAIAQLRAVERHGSRTEKTLGKIGKAAKLWIKRGATVAIAAMAAVMAGATREAIKFAKGMAEVSTLVDTSQVSMQGLRKGLLDLRASSGLALNDLTKGLYQTISAGIDAGKAVQFLGVASKAAIGGVTDVATAVDGMTTAANAWGIEADKASEIADQFFVAVKAGKTTFGELSSSIGTAAPLASALGVELRELLSAAAALTKGGIDTGTAFTYLRGVLSKLLRPSSMAEAEAAKYGISLGAAAVKAKGFTGILEELTAKIGDNQEAQANIFEDVRGLTAVMALVGEQSDDYRQILDEMYTSAGAAEGAFAKMNRTADQQAKIFRARLNVSMINFGDKILPTVNAGLRKLNDWMVRAQGPASTFAARMTELGISIEQSSEAILGLEKMELERKLRDVVAPAGGIVTRIKQVPGPQSSSLYGRRLGQPQPFVDKKVFEAARTVNALAAGSTALRAELEKSKQVIEGMGTQYHNFTDEQKAYFDGLQEAAVLYQRELLPIIEDLERLEAINRVIKEGITRPTVDTVETPGGVTPEDPDDELAKIAKAKDALKGLNRERIIQHAQTEEQKDAVVELFAAEDALNEALAVQVVLGKEVSQFAVEGAQKRKKAAEDLINIMEGLDEDVADLAAGMEEFTDAEIEAAKIAIEVESNMTRVVAAVQSMADVFALFEGFGEVIEGVARGLVKVERARSMLTSATSMSQTILGAGGVLGGFASIAEGFAKRDRQKTEEHNRMVEALQDSTRSYREAIRIMFESETVGGGIRGVQITQAEEAESRIRTLAGRGGLSRMTAKEVEQLLKGLVDAGILDSSVMDLFESQVSSQIGPGLLDLVGGPSLDEWLQENVYGPLGRFRDEFGLAGESLAGVLRNVSLGADVFGESMEQSAERFLTGLLGLDLSDTLREKVEEALTLTGGERTQAMESLAEEITQALTGTRPGLYPNPFGDNLTVADLLGDSELTPDDLRTLVRELLGFSDEGGGRYSSSYQIGRSITDIQANELLAWQETQTMWLERIHQALDSHGERDANIINNFYGVETGDIADRVAESIEHRIREHYVS